MSALGQKQTYAVQHGMSALPPTATSIVTVRRATVAAVAHARGRTAPVEGLVIF